MPTIKKPNQYFDATLYTGNGSAQTITNAGGFQPDLVWQKPRSEIASHRLVDSVRGVNKVIYSNQTDTEATDTNTLTAFNSNGFTGGGSNAVSSSQTAVAWQWKAGGASTVNTSGAISSNVSVNTTAGFSVVTYTGAGTSAGTVGHGLGAEPKFMMIKSRSNTANWAIYHVSLGINKLLSLNSTGYIDTISNYWGSSSPTSTVFGVYTGNNIGNNNYLNQTTVAYCWAEVEGYSIFGSYTGNGSTDGPFVYLGFRPKFIMIKRYDAGAESWSISDSARDTYNITSKGLFPDLTSAESTGSSRSPAVQYDFLSNGFKIRGANGEVNGSGWSYIYAAFAESPFKYSNAK